MADLFLEGSKACSRSDSLSGSQIAAEAVARLSELAEPTGSRPSLSQAAETLLAEAEAAHQQKAGFERLDVGLPSVDRLLGGLWPGNLYYIMARSQASGKTLLTIQACRHMATQSHRRRSTSTCSAWKCRRPTFLRISVAAESQWTARQIRAGRDRRRRTTGLNFQAVTKAIGELPIIIDDMPTDIASLASSAPDRSTGPRKHG